LKDTGFRWLFRRAKQLGQIFVGPQFKNHMSVGPSVRKRYEQKNEVLFYQNDSPVGLVPEEELAVKKIFPQPGQKKALIIGCGAGREVFGLEDLGFDVCGIDIALPMIEAAKKIAKKNNSHAKWIWGGLESLDGIFDLIFVSGGITSHIPGQNQRVHFLSQLRRLAIHNTALLHFPAILQLNWRHHYFWSSQAMRVRWHKSWEKGDSARSFLGRHNNTSDMVYFHFYQNPQEVSSELIEAGWAPERLSADTWVGRPA